MPTPASTVLSPPSIMSPLCTASQRCSGAANTTRLSLSMSVNGTVAYVIVPNTPGTSTPARSSPLPSLTPKELRAEAENPDVLLPWMVAPFDATHSGVAEVATPFVRVTVPVNLWNDTTYTLLLAGDDDGDSVPCCHASALQVRALFTPPEPSIEHALVLISIIATVTYAPQWRIKDLCVRAVRACMQIVERYIVNPANCGAVSCCDCASPTLPDLQPTPVFQSSSSGSPDGRSAFPASQATGLETSCDVYTTTQTFAIIGGHRGESDMLSWTVGGATLRASQEPGSGELQLQVVAALRAPETVEAVLQRRSFHHEDDTATGASEIARTAHFRSALPPVSRCITQC